MMIRDSGLLFWATLAVCSGGRHPTTSLLSRISYLIYTAAWQFVIYSV